MYDEETGNSQVYILVSQVYRRCYVRDLIGIRILSSPIRTTSQTYSMQLSTGGPHTTLTIG